MRKRGGVSVQPHKFVIKQASPFVLPWFFIHLGVRLACKVPSSQVYYLRNIEIKTKKLK